MLQKKTRDLITRLLLIITAVVFVLYLVSYAGNKDNLERTGAGLVNPDMTVVCVSSVCLEYNNVRECVDLSSPTMFKMEAVPNAYGLSDKVKNIHFYSLKSGCADGG
jgi:hypothetical protein